MIAYIKGSVTEAGENFLVIDVGCAGIRALAPKAVCAEAVVGASVTLNTHLYIKEDIFQLYAFAGAAELNMFTLLLTVPGVGPKAALSILDNFSAAEITEAVLSDDAKKLSKAQGVGAKTAQMLIFRLKDKLLKTDAAPEAAHSEKTEAVDALEALGYSRSEAFKAVLETAAPDMKTAEIIKGALKTLRKR